MTTNGNRVMEHGRRSQPNGLIDKLLVANRGEIALRIIRTANLLGIRTVALFIEQERKSAYVALADEAISLGNGDLATTFLNIPKIISIALATNSAAIHPGYGFLSENPDFAQACEANEVVFVGPKASILRLTANKSESKSVAASLGIPVLRELKIDPNLTLSYDDLDFPVLIKATYGGGGKGMQIVENAKDLHLHIESSARKAKSYFGNGSLFAETYLRNARHVEVQLLGDHHGNLLHLFERECSIQRNHQKIIEEAPAQFLSTELRNEILEASLKLGNALKYTGAGTLEYLVDESGHFFFMEMNPRIQVEHAITEQITEIDIVAEQLKIASGLPLSFLQEEVKVIGHALEARIYAEHPAKSFIPSTLDLHGVHLPKNNNLRIEADLLFGQPVCSYFDPMLLKLISWGKNRKEAIDLLASGIQDLAILGPENNASYLNSILLHPNYLKDQISVEFCQQNHSNLINQIESDSEDEVQYALIGLLLAKTYRMDGDKKSDDPWSYIGYWRTNRRAIPIRLNDTIFEIRLNRQDGSQLSYTLNGTVYDLKLTGDTGKEVDVEILGHIYQLIYHEIVRGEIIAGWRNRQYRISLPELERKIPEKNAVPNHQTDSKELKINSPMHGKVVEIFIKERQQIRKGDPLILIEAMKTENRILAHRDAIVKHIAVNVGDQVTDRMPLIFLEK